MGIDIIIMHQPLWIRKITDIQLRKYLSALNEFELNGYTDNELLIDTLEIYYKTSAQIENIISLANDVYKEAAIRWYS